LHKTATVLQASRKKARRPTCISCCNLWNAQITLCSLKTPGLSSKQKEREVKYVVTNISNETQRDTRTPGTLGTTTPHFHELRNPKPYHMKQKTKKASEELQHQVPAT